MAAGKLAASMESHVVISGCGFGGLFAARALADAPAAKQMGRLQLSGYPAWLLWLVAHIYFLIGFRNRIVVLIDWARAYWTFERSARIVIQGNKQGP